MTDTSVLIERTSPFGGKRKLKLYPTRLDSFVVMIAVNYDDQRMVKNLKRLGFETIETKVGAYTLMALNPDYDMIHEVCAN